MEVPCCRLTCLMAERGLTMNRLTVLLGLSITFLLPVYILFYPYGNILIYVISCVRVSVFHCKNIYNWHSSQTFRPNTFIHAMLIDTSVLWKCIQLWVALTLAESLILWLNFWCLFLQICAQGRRCLYCWWGSGGLWACGHTHVVIPGRW